MYGRQVGELTADLRADRDEVVVNSASIREDARLLLVDRFEYDVPGNTIALEAHAENLSLNDLLDVEATPSDGSLLQYDESQSQWTAGLRMRFRPGLKCFIVTDPGG